MNFARLACCSILLLAACDGTATVLDASVAPLDARPATRDAEPRPEDGGPVPTHCGAAGPTRIAELSRLESAALHRRGDQVLILARDPTRADNPLDLVDVCGETRRRLLPHADEVWVSPAGSVLALVRGEVLLVGLDEGVPTEVLAHASSSLSARPVFTNGRVLLFDQRGAGRAAMFVVADPIERSVVPTLLHEPVDATEVHVVGDRVLVRSGHPQLTGSPEVLTSISLASGESTRIADGIARFDTSPDARRLLFEIAADGELHVVDLVSAREVVLGHATSSIFAPPFGELEWTGDGRHLLEYADFGGLVQAWDAVDGRAHELPRALGDVSPLHASVLSVAPEAAGRFAASRWVPGSTTMLRLATLSAGYRSVVERDGIVFIHVTPFDAYEGAMHRVPLDGRPPEVLATPVGRPHQWLGDSLLSVVDVTATTVSLDPTTGAGVTLATGTLMLDGHAIARHVAVDTVPLVVDTVLLYRVSDGAESSGLYATALPRGIGR